MSNLITLTRFTSPETLSKRYWLENETIQKAAAAQMYKGRAKRITIPFIDFKKELENATDKQAFGYGVHPLKYPEIINIAVKGKENIEKIILSRTQEYFFYEGSGVLMLDYDPSPYGRSMTQESFINALVKVHPDLAQAARIVRGSVSAGVHKEDEPPRTDKGFHVYIPVEQTEDIKRYGDVLFNRLWLHGFGFIALSASGALLERAIIDAAVFSPERLDFVGKPVISGEGLQFTPPDAIYTEGGFLDTKTLLDLTNEEETEVNRLIDQAKQDLKPQSEVKQGEWVKTKVKALVEKGVPVEKAKETIKKILESKFQDLYGEFIIEFQTGSVSVDAILRDPMTFDNKACADPIEGSSYGTTTAMFYWNNGNPVIHSLAHGQTTSYFLHKSLVNDDDMDSINLSHEYPTFKDSNFYGIAGEVAALAVEHSEADKVAVYFSFLTAAAAMLGRDKFLQVGDSRHYARLFTAIVGASSRARKGTSFKPVERIIKKAEEKYQKTANEFVKESLVITNGGLSSAEGLIYAVRDESEETTKKENTPVWLGVDDKRLLIVEEELGSVFKVAQRDGNLLTPVLRKAWDGGTLAPMTKNNRLRSTDPHINTIGHITQFELKELLSNSDIYNGLINRFLWACVRRTKKLSTPQPMDDSKVLELAVKLSSAFKESKATENNEIQLNAEARNLWDIQYHIVSTDREGIMGAVTARNEAHVLRLALLFCLLDGMAGITTAHLKAAIAVVDYSTASCEFIFTVPSEESPDAQKLLSALDIKALSQTEISKLFNGNKTKAQLTQLLTDLQTINKIRKHTTPNSKKVMWEIIKQ